MKQKEFLLIAVIVIVSAVISSIAANAIFNSSDQRKEKVAVVEPISSKFPPVQNDSDYQAFFNPNAINPTQLIKIGTSQNTTPFNEKP
ncbi:hypothetical protein H0X09_03335 [Candidatus Saccharibacteria bacterium]|nr:hypothetical protein [Candidatus Saccharibacteria bacterium]